ncbi:MAG: hypothetical protein IJ719_12545 [Clostridia bacterium]|nr:hypothetical protein [Clostridia bacterium]
MKKVFAAIAALMTLLCVTSCAEERVDTLTYAVFPYLPDVGYYQEIIERRWAEVEPNIQLVRAEWDCYTDDAPEGIDVVMFDAVMLNKVIASGWIQAIDQNSVHSSEDMYPFALEGLTVEGKLYGIPTFFCGNFLIYDQNCEILDSSEHITDLTDLSEILVVNSGNPLNRPQYIIKVIADTTGEANPSVESDSGNAMWLIDRLAIDAHEHDDDVQVVMAYDSGVGQGYIGFSESIRLLKRRAEATRIKAISFSANANMPRLYVDAGAVTTGVKGQRYEKCLELINIMAEADVLTELSVQDGVPQYLLLARRTPYRFLSRMFPLYTQMEELASDENNHVILTP